MLANECGCDDGSCSACAPRPNTAKPGYYGNGWPVAHAAIEREAYRLLDRLAANDLSDPELERLNDISAELDRRGVPYQERGPQLHRCAHTDCPGLPYRASDMRHPCGTEKRSP